MLGAPWAKTCGRLSHAGFENSGGASNVAEGFAWQRAYKQYDDDSANKHSNLLQPEQEDIATIGSKIRSRPFLKFYLFGRYLRNSDDVASLEIQLTDCINTRVRFRRQSHRR